MSQRKPTPAGGNSPTAADPVSTGAVPPTGETPPAAATPPAGDTPPVIDAPPAANSSKLAEARALLDLGKLGFVANDVIVALPETIAELVAAGMADDHPDAVAYAKSLQG